MAEVDAIGDATLGLDDWIDQLTGLAATAPGRDRLAIGAHLGCALLDRYTRDNADQDFTSGIALIQLAVGAILAPQCRPNDVAAPRFTDVGTLLGAVGQAYRVRGHRRGDCGDLAEAVRQLDRAGAGRQRGDGLELLRLEIGFEHYWAAQGDNPPDHDVALAEIDCLVLAALEVPGAEPDSRVRAARLQALAVLERHRLTGARSDLDAAIEQLATLLPRLREQPDLHLEAASALVEAYQRRADLDEDVASVELALAVADQALAGVAPTGVGWRDLLTSKAIAHEQRWRVLGERLDLDAAVGCWRALVTPDPDGPAGGDLTANVTADVIAGAAADVPANPAAATLPPMRERLARALRQRDALG